MRNPTFTASARIGAFLLVASGMWTAGRLAAQIQYEDYSICKNNVLVQACPSPGESPPNLSATDYYCDQYAVMPATCSDYPFTFCGKATNPGPYSLGGCGYKKSCLTDAVIYENGAPLACTETVDACVTGWYP